MDCIDVAIFDNGINPIFLKSNLHLDIDVNDDILYADKGQKSGENDLNHGSICAQILERYSSNIRISSIKVLNNAGKGFVSSLKKAFELCVCRNIRIINLSLGTNNYFDKSELRTIINHYVSKGLIIIAASSNNEYCTYPASFANVIGVCSGYEFAVNIQEKLSKGIDFVAPSNHEVEIGGVSFRLGKSNSFAAPYVTALVADLIYEKGLMTIDEIRDYLCVKRDNFVYSPDWIETAWITPNYQKSKAEYYFNEDNRILQECFDHIDTIVISNLKEIELYGDVGKHIVYIGSESVAKTDKAHHFWSKESRIEQIMSSRERRADIEIPLIYCIFDNQIDIIWCLCELKRLLADEGYNAFTGYNSIDSVLYDLEYLPQEETIHEKLVDYIYWQISYQQSDLALIGFNDKNDGFSIEPDMIVYIDSESSGINVKIVYDGCNCLKKEYPDLELENIRRICSDIICCFEKEDE